MHNALKYITLLAIIYLNICGKNAYAQLFNFTNYTVEKGFPQSNADFIMQDNEGFMWFATQNGAVKFNGYDYTVYNKDNGLKSNFVIHILQDSKERFWFSTKKGLTELKKNKFKTYTENDGLFSNIIYKTFELPTEELLIVTTEGTNILSNDTIKKISEDIKPRDIILRNNNEIWILTEKNIYIYDKGKFKKPKINIKKIKTPFNSFIEDKKSNLWIATNNGIYKIFDNKIKHFNTNSGLLNNNINKLLIDSENNLWYSSEQKGCGFYSQNLFHNLTVNSGLTNSVVLSLYEDSEKNIWIGGRNGVTMINTGTPFIHYDQISSFDNEIVMGILPDKDNNIWFCTYGFGLVKFNGENYTQFNKQKGSIDDYFFDIETDKNGNFWLASGNNGIIKFNGKKFTQIKTKDSPEYLRVLTIFKDSKENLWFGTNNEGVYKYDGRNLTRFGSKQGFTAKTVMTICEDDDNNIWFGTINSGLLKYDGKTVVKTNTNIELDFIRSIVNRKGTLWIGTGSSGIYKIIKTENKKYHFEQYQKEDGLNSNNIYFLFPDSKGNLWCGSEKGVDKIIFDENNILTDIKNYTKDDGFIGVETNINGAAEDAKGNIWFGTVNGAVRYNEDLDKMNIVENKTYLSDIQLFFKDVDWFEYSDSVNYNNIPIKLTLPHKLNHLTFNFIGLCFSNPQKVKYKYRLLGQNEIWSPETYDKKAVFTNITPGKYEFQVISANNDDLWNAQPVSFKFTIKPPYWRQTWFYTLSLFLLLIILYIAIDLRMKSLKKAKSKLEIKVLERTVEINKQKEELLQTNTKITDSIDYAGKIQNAMLPTMKIFERNFSDFFIINHPRDIVSGDFYWAREFVFNNEAHIVTVVADCTGHGIPGALVSMLGMSLLNEIIRKENITQANQVLEELRKEIKVSLKQKGGLDDQTEGIDMVICSVNKKTNELQYAGANNPLYLIRNGKLTIFNPTINPVGIFIKEIPFKNEQFQLQKNDILYMFSDGYVDQFNGKTGEKFKIKQFRDLLLSISEKTMKEQKQILENTFIEWKANSAQIDDILIAGIKI
ncbi:MAG: SpoIIE family protein phosphatase [Bacteroidales bacterium]|nr:SpoIIE family protein phosphatase [Bacteroidales bacterium]